MRYPSPPTTPLTAERVKELVTGTMTQLLEQEAIQGALAYRIAVELGYRLEGMIEQKVRKALSKMEVKF